MCIRDRGHAQKCVSKYCELADVRPETLKKVATPNIDDNHLLPKDFEEKGELSKIAARIVLTALYLARFSRPDILWTVNSLARMVTKWNVACDKRLHRLISYIHHTQSYKQIAYVGDKPQDIKLALFADASFAGDLQDSKSTGGGFLFLVG